MDFIVNISPLFIAIGIIVILFLLILASGYVKSPPDIAYIISGLRKEPKFLLGRAGIKLPFFERADKLLVKQISIDIKTNGCIPTKDFIGVDIDAVAKVRLDVSEKGRSLAMKNFLNMSSREIAEALTDSLQGNMREIIGTVTLKELCNDRKKFGDEVQEKAQKDMEALGVIIISCNIQKIDDENDLIIALGQDNMSQIQKDASIAKAQAERDVNIAQAEAMKEANDVRVESETAIAERNNELELKRAELKIIADTKKAEADAAYEIQQEEQRKTIEVTKANADIAKQDRENELKSKEVEAKKQTLNAEIREKAEADRYAAQQKADAEKYTKIAEADAELAERRAKAEADKYEVEMKAAAKERDAEAVRKQGEAEAAAIQAKGTAEAEAIQKKAEAMKEYGNAAITEMIVKVLPQMADSISKNISSIDKLTVIDSGSGNTVANIGGYTPNLMAQVIESVKAATGFDLTDVLKASTYDAKVNNNIALSGDVNECIHADSGTVAENELDVKTE